VRIHTIVPLGSTLKEVEIAAAERERLWTNEVGVWGMGVGVLWLGNGALGR